jgi:hypothetical protein
MGFFSQLGAFADALFVAHPDKLKPNASTMPSITQRTLFFLAICISLKFFTKNLV